MPRKDFGSIHTTDGSPTGAAITTERLAYVPGSCQVEYVGEAPAGSLETDPTWFIEKLVYDVQGHLTQTLTPSAMVRATGTSITLSANVNPLYTNVTIIGGTLPLICPKDVILLNTPTQPNNKVLVIQILAANSFVISAPLTPETWVPSENDLIAILTGSHADPAKRTWVDRESYLYF